MIIATAGHVDHGKTTLVRALTGVDTDRLPEEKKRGLTIDIGFAYGQTEKGAVLGFVDVPGHEKFVKNMLAGVPAVDHALIVVAADDGIMPQTLEHLAILELLAIPTATIVITKIDRVEDSRIEIVTQEIKDLLKSTSLRNSPIYRTSFSDPTGAALLQRHLHLLANSHKNNTQSGRFRLAVDRAFTISGAGIIVTGSVFSGNLKIGDNLILSPAGIQVRVRGLRALNVETSQAKTGERCALNISGPDLNISNIRRGDWLLDESAHLPTNRIDARLKILATEEHAFKHWTPVHVHIGASDISGRVAILGQKSIPPGSDALVQLNLDNPSLTTFGDRFILRDQSASRTIGGGVIIDPSGPSQGRARPQRLEILRAFESSDTGTAFVKLLDLNPEGIFLRSFSDKRNLSENDARMLFDRIKMVLVNDPKGPLALSHYHWNIVTEELLERVTKWHNEHTDQLGPTESALKKLIPSNPSLSIVRNAATHLVSQQKLVRDGTILHLPTHRPSMSAEDTSLWNKTERLLLEGGLRPPRIRELAESLNVNITFMETFLRRMVKFGCLIPVAKNRFFPPNTLHKLATIGEELAAKTANKTFDVIAFKDKSGIGRNVAIEVLEYFDTIGFTKRTENVRKIVRPAKDLFTTT